MDEDEFRLTKADWASRLHLIAHEIRDVIGQEIAGDCVDEELSEIGQAIDAAAHDIETLSP